MNRISGADLSVVLEFDDLTVQGTVYKFSHLLPFVETLPKAGREGADVSVRVSFQSHVFSTGNNDANVTGHLVDEGGKSRLFCSTRYGDCLALPDFGRRLIQGNFLTWESEDRLTNSNMAVIDGNLATGQHLVAFYYLFPSGVPTIDVELVMKSAYRKHVDFSHIKRRHNVQSLIKQCYYQGKKIPK